MEKNIQQDERYFLAEKRVKSIKGFYSHVFIYIVINAIILGQIYLRTPLDKFWEWENFQTALFWGIGLLAHALSVFAKNYAFSSNWEERKIREFMEKDKVQKWE